MTSDAARESGAFHTWHSANGKAAIEIGLDVVERILADVMRGFGAVPKRGAEVGGILLGSASPGDPSRLRIEGHESVAIEYRRGPSFLLSGNDTEVFEQALARARKSITARPCGFYRSHTRDSEGLTGEDLTFADTYFPDPGAVALLIRPYATKACTAGFFVKQNGAFPTGAPENEFPFRRRDLDGGTSPAPVSRSLGERAPAPRIAARPAFQSAALSPASLEIAVVRPKRLPVWGGVLLGLLLAALGGAAGFAAAAYYGPSSITRVFYDPRFHLALTASGGDLRIGWDRAAPALLSATRASVSIEDGAYRQAVELDAAHLTNGAIFYRHLSGHVRVRMEIFQTGGSSTSETKDWARP